MKPINAMIEEYLDLGMSKLELFYDERSNPVIN